MITDEQIKLNKERFINTLSKINREGADIEGLISKLETTDFFIAPSSTQFHTSYKGGLCEHSLNVYDQLVRLTQTQYGVLSPYDENSMIIVSLLHDLSKMNYYEVAERNTKDENGNWIKVPFIKTREAKDRFVYGSHGVNSEYIAGRYIPLKLEESVAIINHMGGKEVGGNGFDTTMSEIFNRFPLAIMLHLADMSATFILEALK